MEHKQAPGAIERTGGFTTLLLVVSLKFYRPYSIAGGRGKSRGSSRVKSTELMDVLELGAAGAIEPSNPYCSSVELDPKANAAVVSVTARRAATPRLIDLRA